MNRQPTLPSKLVSAATGVVDELAKSVPHQQAAVLVHAATLEQHALQVGLGSLADVARLHPGLAELADLDTTHPAISALWAEHQLMPDDECVQWWTYPLGDLYQTLSTESRKGRALCQTPWWVSRLLLHTSYDRAQETWKHPKVIDPSCGTGHLLLEAFHRAMGQHRFHDGYSAVAPYLRHQPSLPDALDRVHGVDLDPYAALVARYRLLVLAWARLRHTHDTAVLRDLPIHVATADSLLADDEPILARHQYHVVVANPPYITCKDATTTQAIRDRYPEVCSGKFSLALPFHALMMELLVDGGWCAQLTANSFMKREFGKKYVEQWLARFDMQWVVDSSGAYIPGHGTPTVILVNRNQPPTAETVHTVLGVRGEPSQPADPSRAVVWAAIEQAVYATEAADRLDRGSQSSWLADNPQRLEPAPEAAPRQMNLFELAGDAA